MNSLQRISKDLGKMITKNSTTILTGMGVAGFVTTVVTAVNATPKALEILAEEQVRRKREGVTKEYELIPKKDIIRLTWKKYLPSAIIGTLSIACFVSANSINLRRNAALAGAYTLAETTLKEYRSKVVETIGENKARQIKDDIAQDKVRNNPVKDEEIIFTGKGDTLCYDALSGRYFKSDIEFIRKTLNDLSVRLMNENTISLNDIYYALGLEDIGAGEYLEFNVDDGLLEPKFSATLTSKNTPCLVLDLWTEPRSMMSRM